MRRTARQRAAAASLALLCQSIGIALLYPGVRRETPEPDSDRMLVFLLPPPAASPPQLRRTVPVVTDAPHSAMQSPVFIALEPAQAERSEEQPLGGTDATLEAPINWYSDMANAAQRAVERLERQKQRDRHGELLDSKPLVPDQPHVVDHPAMTVERLDNGDLITRARITDRTSIVCRHEHGPVTEHFDVSARMRLPKCRKVDTAPPLRFGDREETESGRIRLP